MKLTIEPRGEVFRMAGGELVQVWGGSTSEGRPVTVLVAGVSGLYGEQEFEAAPSPAAKPRDAPPSQPPDRLGVRAAATRFGLTEFQVIRICERHPGVATRVSGRYRNGRTVYAIDADAMALAAEARKQKAARKGAGLSFRAAALRLGISEHSVRRYCDEHPHVVDWIENAESPGNANHAAVVDVGALAAVIAASPREKWARRPVKDRAQQPVRLSLRAAAERTGATVSAVRKYCQDFPHIARRLGYSACPGGLAYDIDIEALAAVIAAHPRRRWRRQSRRAHASPHQAPATSGPGASPGTTTATPGAPHPSHSSSASTGAGGLSTA